MTNRISFPRPKQAGSHSYLFLILVVVLILALSAGCHLIFPYSSTNLPQQTPYYCQAQIYRALAGAADEFTEEWKLWSWPPDENGDNKIDQADAVIYCTAKVNDYIAGYMAPGFAWGVRNLTVNASETRTGPFLDKRLATDCPGVIGPPAFGAPLGSDLVWLDPPESLAWVRVAGTTNSGEYVEKTVGVSKAIVRFAERTGLPDQLGVYVPGTRHVRFSDVYLELEDFELAGVTFTDWYVQSIGTVIAEYIGGTSVGFQYIPRMGDAKFYLYAHGSQEGGSATTSKCFASSGNMASYAKLTVNQGPAFQYVAFLLEATSPALGEPFDLKVSVHTLTGMPFTSHQPVVTYVGPTAPETPVVTLNANAFDHDNDLVRILWFEDFEKSSERYLGTGNPLPDITFGLGDHAVTAVAYDARGAYNSETATVTVVNSPPQTAADGYTVDEDEQLTVDAPGVLGNDSDVNGDILSAVKASDPDHGSVVLNANGSFAYTPNPNYFGLDYFTYRASDGALQSDPVAQVSITVVEAPPDVEAANLGDKVDELLSGGSLNPGQAQSLKTKLAQIAERITAGKTAVACNLLQAFVNEVQALVQGGVLTAQEGAVLIDKAGNLSMELSCPLKAASQQLEFRIFLPFNTR